MGNAYKFSDWKTKNKIFKIRCVSFWEGVVLAISCFLASTIFHEVDIFVQNF